MSAQVEAGHNGEGWQKGGWTLQYPELGTGPVTYESAISPEAFEVERNAVFRRRWLNVGHVCDLPSIGSFFTKELPVCGTSIIVVRGKDDVVRAFHNICAHRGNKLVWKDSPTQETSGVCRMFRCKYHGWSYDLEGKCQRVTDEEAFFDLDKAQLSLSAVHCSVWKGWIFVNFASTPPYSLEDALGEIGAGLENYPAERLTTQYRYVGEVHCNWKVVHEAFMETYHSAYLHSPMRGDIEQGAVLNHALHFFADSKGNRMGGYYGSDDIKFLSPIQRAFRANLFGPLDAPDFGYKSMQDLPSGLNRSRHPQWGLDAIVFHPNFHINIWWRNWITVHRFWPLAHDRTQFELELCFEPPKNVRQRVAQELMRVTVKDFALQDLNLLPGTFQMLQSRARSQFYLGDEEFMVRHFQKTVARDVESYQAAASKGTEVHP